jgi:hypothetical protein
MSISTGTRVPLNTSAPLTTSGSRETTSAFFTVLDLPRSGGFLPREDFTTPSCARAPWDIRNADVPLISQERDLPPLELTLRKELEKIRTSAMRFSLSWTAAFQNRSAISRGKHLRTRIPRPPGHLVPRLIPHSGGHVQTLAAYVLPRRVGDKLLDQFLFRQASRAAKLYKTLLRFSQCNPKLLRIALLPDRDVEPEYSPVPAHGQRLVPRKIPGGVIPELPYAYILRAPPSLLLKAHSCDHTVPQILASMPLHGSADLLQSRPQAHRRRGQHEGGLR